jgi:neutral ceramidase
MPVRLLAALLLLSTAAFAEFRAGAARVDITPAPNAALPMSGYGSRTEGFKGIHDPIYVRAIVVDDGATQAAIVAWELIFVPDAVWAEVSPRIAAETGIAPDHLILAAVHDHGAPTPSGDYARKVEDAAIEAIRLAKSRLQPARFGYGAGTAHINVNRRELTPAQGWWLGYNEQGASDKVVHLLRFEDTAGKPIAFLINYAVHVVVMGPDNYQITGDLAGATSRFVEQHYAAKDRPRSDAGPRLRLRPAEKNEDVVAVWTSGAAGDQNPISMATGNDFFMVDALGKILGEEVVRTAGAIQTTPDARIRAAQQVATCPGRRVEDGARPRADYKFTDAAPVNLRLTLLTLGDVQLAGVSGEVLNPIYQHLRRQSAPRTVMITHANGSSGYIPDDAGFEQIGYEVTTSRLKPGCAENAIVNGVMEMVRRK